MNINRKTGEIGEAAVAAWLKKHRYKIIDQNFSCRFGEIDIIAEKGEYICFVEVKTRAADSWERPAVAVDSAKQRRIITTAQYYLASNPSALQPRLDVAEVINDGHRAEINYIEDAFGE